MSEFNITVEGGSSVRLPTAGKYVDRDIIVTATGSTETPENLDDVLTKQEQLIDQLTIALDNKASGGGEALGADIYIIYGGQLFTLWEFVAVAFPDFGVTEEYSVVMVTDDPPTYKQLPGYALFIVSPTSGKSQVIWAEEEGDVGYITLQDLSGLPDHGWIEKETLEALDKTADSNMGIYAVKTASYPLVDGTLREFESRTRRVKEYAFAYCITLESVSLPNATFIGRSAFDTCYALKNVYAPEVKKIYADTFYECDSLTDIELPEVQEISPYSFYLCSSLVNVYLPKARFIGYTAFAGCEALPKIDLPKATSIDSAFSGCSSLHTVILRNDTPATLASHYIFEGTPIENGDGYIYVPKSLVETYKTETNWTVYANQIRAIEDYPEICGG